jgi:uncharacterized protein (UPF0276 family)
LNGGLALRLRELPVLGLGLGAGPNPPDDVIARIDYFEPYADERLAGADGESDGLPEDFPRVLHGAKLSPIGGDGIPASLIESHRAMADRLRSPWVVEDLAVWRLDGRTPIGTPFWPPVLTAEAVDLVASRLDPLAELLGRPFLCEVAPLELPVGDLTLSEFFRRLCGLTGCGLTLDVSHVLHYAQLVGREFEEVIDEFPLDHVIELHITGGTRRPGPRWYAEEHSAQVLPECAALLDYTLARCPNARAVTVETHGAPDEAVRGGLDLVAATSSVRALRARRSAGWPARVSTTTSRGGEAAAVQVLERPAPPGLVRQQHTVRRLLERPEVLEAFADGDLDLPPDDRKLFPPTAVGDWEQASRRHLGRLAVLSPEATAVTRLIFADPSDYLRALQAERPDDAPPPAALDVLSFLTERAEIPEWARDVLAFSLDLELVAAGREPRRPTRSGPVPNSLLLVYPRSIVGTLNALARREPLPPARPTEVLLTLDDERVHCSEVGEPGTVRPSTVAAPPHAHPEVAAGS